jgi:agmatinase
MTPAHGDVVVSGAERLPEETWPDSRMPPRTFFGAQACPELDDLDAQIAFIGVPYDLGGPIRGARFGPDGVRDARVYSCTGHDGVVDYTGYYDIDTDRMCLEAVTMADCGDVLIVPSDVDRNFWRTTRALRTIIGRGSLPVAVGGDHAITPAVVRAFDSHAAIDIVHFDAHHDFMDQFQGIRWGHGSPIRRASELPWVRNITQIGLRVATGRGPIDDARARGNRIVTTDQFRNVGPEAAMALLPESDAIYVTFDIDVMDPALCPGTGAPEPGGLTYPEMRSALRSLAKRGPIIGIDLVEVAPPLDPTGITSKTAARLVLDLLTAIWDTGGLPRQSA